MNEQNYLGYAAGERSAVSYVEIVNAQQLPDDEETAERFTTQWADAIEQAAMQMAVGMSDPLAWFEGWRAGFEAKLFELWPVEE